MMNTYVQLLTYVAVNDDEEPSYDEDNSDQILVFLTIKSKLM